MLSKTSSSDETGVTSLHAKTVLSVEEGDKAIDEGATERSVSFNSAFVFVPSFDIAEREEEEKVKRALAVISDVELSRHAMQMMRVRWHLLKLLAMDEETKA